MWSDAHAHLYGLTDRELGGEIDAARKAGVSAIVNTAVSLSTARDVIRQSRLYPGILRPAAGISPFDVDDLPPSWADSLGSFLDRPGVVAVGECGIDATNPRYPPLDRQAPVFEAQCALAAQRRLTLVVHSRGAEERAVAVCRAAGVTRALFHCFTGTVGALEKVLDAGYFVSFSGIVTFGGAAAAELVSRTPLDRMLVETDTPYLAPVPFRGKPNRPAWVVRTAAAVARLRNVDETVLAESVRRNFETLFGHAAG